MIDFELTENDKKILDEVRTRALVCRKYARYYDENEQEFPPDELPETMALVNSVMESLPREITESMLIGYLNDLFV